MNKAALRTHLKNTRRDLGAVARTRASAAIVEHLRALPQLRDASAVGAFWPLRTEVDLRALFHHPEPGRWALPVVTGSGRPLTFRDASGPMEPGPFGVAAPTASATEVPISQLDLLLMPALGVDRNGGRIGYGGGFYDRTLAHQPSLLRLGVVFHAQVVDQVPRESHDLPLHGFVTEQGVFWA